MTSKILGRSAWLAAGLVLAALVALSLLQSLDPDTLVPISAVIAAPPVGDIPMMDEKPPASPEGFNGCPPEGEGGDPQLNLLKNRVDKATYAPVSMDSLMALTWPKSAEQSRMDEWTPAGHAFISQYLGIPIVVDGYIEALREGISDAANCNRGDENNHFWRLSITKGPKDRRAQAVVGISSPQTRIGHTWSAQFIRDVIIEGRLQVRVSGWLFFNPDPPYEIGRTRATLWEINPVMQIEVFQDGRWNPLDKYGK